MSLYGSGHKDTDTQTLPVFFPETITIHFVNEMTKCKNIRFLTKTKARKRFQLSLQRSEIKLGNEGIKNSKNQGEQPPSSRLA